MLFNDITSSNIVDKMLYYIAPTNQLEESELNKIKWFNIWYGVLANIMTGIFSFDDMERIVKKRIKQSFFISNYVASFEYDDYGVIISPVIPKGDRNAWGEYTQYSAILPNGEHVELNIDDCVIGSNYTIPSINDNLLCYQYAEQLAEMEISIKNSVILSRLTDIIEVDSDHQVNEVLDDINSRKNGAPFVIKKKRPDSETHTLSLTQPVEVSKYYDSVRDCLNEFLTVTGLSSLVNPNKKERLITDEVSSNDDIKNTLLANRIENVFDFIDETNKKFGTDYKVSIDNNIFDTVNTIYGIEDEYDTEEVDDNDDK